MINTIRNKELEKAFGRKVVPIRQCLGLDIASRTGWCRATTNDAFTTFEYGFIDIDTTDKYFKYNQSIEAFNSLIEEEYWIVIEESFYGRNVHAFQMLSRLGGFAYTIAHLKGVKNKYFLSAVQARKGLGLPSTKKKAEVHKAFISKVAINLEDPDIIDAMILSLNGILKPDSTLRD